MSQQSDREIEALIDLLLEKMREKSNGRPEIGRFAAGTTRLGKIETIHDHAAIEETLLIRIRQKRYTSAACIEQVRQSAPSNILIHAEHKSGAARSVIIPFKRKRPNRITFGEFYTQTESAKWFSSHQGI